MQKTRFQISWRNREKKINIFWNYSQLNVEDFEDALVCYVEEKKEKNYCFKKWGYICNNVSNIFKIYSLTFSFEKIF